LAAHFEAALIGKVDAQQDHLGPMLGEQAQRVGPGSGFDNSKAGLAQNIAFDMAAGVAAVHVKDCDF
jgi:hypothetical protein